MSGRRSHPRFVVASPWSGTLRVLRDVIVTRTSERELMALSQVHGVAGELVTVELMAGGLALSLGVEVVESRPVIVSGAVRHRLRLSIVEWTVKRPAAADPADAQAALAAETR